MITVLWAGAEPGATARLAAGWDKLAHIALHFVLCALLLLALQRHRGLQAVLLCAAFAALDEWAQQFSPGRSVSWADWAFSVAGALLALAAAHASAWWIEMQALQNRRLRRLQALAAGLPLPR